VTDGTVGAYSGSMDTNSTPHPDRPLAHAWCDVLAEMWRVAWRHPRAWAALHEKVKALAETLADREGYDADGNSPEEQALLSEVDEDEQSNADMPVEDSDSAA